MSTIRFGSSSSPCKTAAERIQPCTEETVEGEGCDPNKLLQCPFDKNHQIRACRFPYHLIKCRKNHPQLASELKTCPFNASHLIPKHELIHHTSTCVDRRSMSTEDWGNVEGQYKWQVPVSTWTNPNTSEDWDQEADDGAAPFVWGESTSLNQKLEANPTNNLTPSFRAPNTLPWSICRP
ncbi:gametocyte-specific factor 1 [Centroberyx affinis]|uniref:gametocyte-specific factor 1 n=1 Tax=Centroberyx affinis TaxID=166261 RepID=UPI003A5BB587